MVTIIYIYIYIHYVCVYIYIYIHTHIHTYIHIIFRGAKAACAELFFVFVIGTGVCGKAELRLSSFLRCSNSIFWRNSGEFWWILVKSRWNSGKACWKTGNPQNKIAQPPRRSETSIVARLIMGAIEVSATSPSQEPDLESHLPATQNLLCCPPFVLSVSSNPVLTLPRVVYLARRRNCIFRPLKSPLRFSGLQLSLF